MKFRNSILLLAVLFSLLAIPEAARSQMTAVVNSMADDEDSHPWDDTATVDIDESIDGICKDAQGRCTLRAALEEAENIGIGVNVTFSATGTITAKNTFNVPSGSTITGPGFGVKIEGGTAYSVLMGLSDNTSVSQLVFANSLEGIVVGGHGNSIGVGNVGNIIYGMEDAGILIGGNDNTVRANFIGFDVLSTAPGNVFGIFITGSNNLIGGTISSGQNVISGNTVAGVAIVGDTADGGATANRISGNYIGIKPSGLSSLPNTYGVELLAGTRNVVGGESEDERNIISGNDVAGILLGTGNTGSLIRGNRIGTSSDGGDSIPNKTGIILGPDSHHAIVIDNHITSNREMGIQVKGFTAQSSTQHQIRGNQIFGNRIDGIQISGNAFDNTVGSSLSEDFEPNQIFANGLGGLLILPESGGVPRTNTIRKNSFHDHLILGMGIDSTTQDGIRRPKLLSIAQTSPGLYSVSGTHSRPGSVIDVYTAERGDESITAEGRTWLASGSVGGNGTFSVPFLSCSCELITATATDLDGNTSEFSDTLPFIVTGVQDGRNRPSLPTTYSLADAYPNPFNPKTTIGFGIPNAGMVTLKVYNLLGEEVATVLHEVLPPGEYIRSWDAGNVESGVYFYRLTAGIFTESRKLLLIR